MNQFCNENLDKEFEKISDIQYLPWIGKNYLLQEDKVLIIGESVYNWENPEDVEKRQLAQERLDKSDFARVVVYEHGIDNPNSNNKFARNIEKTFGINVHDGKERLNFWKKISFHELVQRPMENVNNRPSIEDYKIGAEVLISIIKIIRPNKCVFLGTTWEKYKSLKNNLENNYSLIESHFEKVNNSKPKVISIEQLNTKIYFIKHPSKFYSYNIWKDFIKSN